MLSRAVSTLAFVLAISGAAAADSSQEPFGYLYLFRTMHLVPLTVDESRIGRLPENEIVLTSERASRRHAVLRRGEGGVEVVDVGSTNGTRLNGREIRPRAPVPLGPGDLVAFADEPALFHTSLDALWRDELRHRLLSSIVKLHLPLPQDRMRKSFGRDEVELSETEARVSMESGKVDVEHSVPLDPGDGFPEGSGALVGHVAVEDGVLELSLWTIAAGQSMTSRRASFTNLKHATLSIAIAEKSSDGTEAGGRTGPWFPSTALGALFDTFPDEPDFILQFMHSLTNQDRPVALRDAAATFAFRHRLTPDDWKLLLLAAQSKGLWVERETGERGLSLTQEYRTALLAALDEARGWLGKARELGAKGDGADEAEAILVRASERLSRLQSIP